VLILVCGCVPCRWRKWQDTLEQKRRELRMLERRATIELQKALDQAGQVGGETGCWLTTWVYVEAMLRHIHVNKPPLMRVVPVHVARPFT
jgi:hypothetical protein